MAKKTGFGLVVLLVVLTMLLGACGTGQKVATSSKPATTSVAPATTAKPAATTTAAPAATTAKPSPTRPAPKYGGAITAILRDPPTTFDEAFGQPYRDAPMQLISDELLTGDWSKGPAGTGATTWAALGCADVEFSNEVGSLAESWQVPDAQTVIFKLRKGIHWQNKAPVNGREFVASDVKFTLDRLLKTTTSYLYTNYIGGWMDSVECTDNYTVVVHAVPEAKQRVKTPLVLGAICDLMCITPHEVIEKYNDMKDWKNVVGTGPFILDGFVENSSWSLKKNPDYWRTDPLHPGNKLPYVDSVKVLLISDPSTRLAAMRVMSADWLDQVETEDFKELTKSQPNIKSLKEFRPQVWNIYLRTDIKPFSDIRVRRAMHMSIDLKTIADKYYSGDAVALSYPVTPYKDFMDVYTPIEKLPASTQELFTYNPTKAKQLLAEAGYPQGFKTSIVCETQYVDILSLAKSYLANIGVDMEMDVREYAVWNSITTARTQKELAFRYQGIQLPFKLQAFRAGAPQNLSMVTDQKVEDAMTAIWSFQNMNDPAKRRATLKDISTYILDQAWFIQLPLPYVYTVWTPWLGDYHGEWRVGSYNDLNWTIYTWVDQDLKKSLGK